MAQATYITEWGQFTDPVPQSKATNANYQGSTDWVKQWADEKSGATNQTSFQVSNRTAPAINWATQVAWTVKNDDSLLTQNNAKTQVPSDQLTQAPRRTGTPASSGSWSYVANYGSGSGGSWWGSNVL